MKSELTVDVYPKLTVTDEQAERCLRLLEMWQEDNPDKFIQGDTKDTESGRKTVFQILRRTEY